MNVAACCLAVAGALLSIFQPMSMPLFSFLRGSFFDLLLTVTNPTARAFFQRGGNLDYAWMVLGIAFCLAALGIWGGHKALKHEGGKGAIILNAVIYLGIFALPNMAARSRGMPFWVFTEIGLWGGLYAAAAICAMADKGVDAETSQTPTPVSPSVPVSTPSPASVSPLHPTSKDSFTPKKEAAEEEPTIAELAIKDPVLETEAAAEPTVKEETAASDLEATADFDRTGDWDRAAAIENTLDIDIKENEPEPVAESLRPVQGEMPKRGNDNVKAGLVAIVLFGLPALCYGGYKWLEKHDQQIREETRREVLASIEAERKANMPMQLEIVPPTKNMPTVTEEVETKVYEEEEQTVQAVEPEVESETEKDETQVLMSIRGTKINLRRAPDINARSDVLLDEGTPVEVIHRDTKADEVWFFVRLDSGREGWVLGDYTRERLRATGEHGGDFMAIKGTDVNLRSGPSKKTSSVAKLNDGNLIEVMYYKIQKDGKWYFIHTLNGKSGWVFGNYLRNRRSF